MKRALIADDTDDMRMLMRVILTASGWEVRHEVGTGTEALSAWQEDREQIEALVLDHKMPGLTGIEVAGQVRREDALLPIFLVTAYLSDDLRSEASALDVVCVDKVNAASLSDFLPTDG